MNHLGSEQPTLPQQPQEAARHAREVLEGLQPATRAELEGPWRAAAARHAARNTPQVVELPAVGTQLAEDVRPESYAIRRRDGSFVYPNDLNAEGRLLPQQAISEPQVSVRGLRGWVERLKSRRNGR